MILADDLGLERDVVVHEQHVRCPTLVTQLHQAAGEPARTAEVAVRDDRRDDGVRRLELEVAGVVDDQQPQRSPRSVRCPTKSSRRATLRRTYSGRLNVVIDETEADVALGLVG